MSSGFDAIAQFFKFRVKDLKRIAYGAQENLQLSDVESEAWLEAQKLEASRGAPVNFLDRGDQDHLLARLYNRLVKYANKTLRYAVSLDADWDREENTSFGATLARMLAAPAGSDPQSVLDDSDEELIVAEAVQNSYSEASAYVLLLARFDWNATELAADLRIALTTLRLRVRVAGLKVKIQDSLFDRIEQIKPDFSPTTWAPRAVHQVVHLEGEQRAWTF